MAEIKLNKNQQAAVEEILNGPLLVLAGPGTGKTQLLSAGVANILAKTDTLASNILCLTFTEKGASNMLERLTSFIGQEAYSVNIHTYHAFGGSLISSYPQYFSESRMENPVDELGQHEIINEIVEKLSYQNPLKYIGTRDIIATISEAKQALLTPSGLEKIAAENSEFLEDINPKISQIFNGLARMPGSLTKAVPYFDETLTLLEAKKNSLANTAKTNLKTALEEASELGKSAPLTKWKNDWLVKNSQDEFVLDGKLAAKRLTALANIMKDYQAALARRGLYDYDDMILASVRALENNDDLRFTLQEKYQYILLDEYQDTNAAQAKLVELLTNNPASEGRPNVMAVGDDDQAIYSFQGAEASNLNEFARRYRDTKIICLTDNYRSQPDILTFAGKVAGQIEDRASTSFESITKELVFRGDQLAPTIVRPEFLSQVAERDWVAREIEGLITKKGVQPSQIAVIAPRHKLLEPLVPFLNALNIPVRYEKRENILEAPVIRQLITMSRLVEAINNQNQPLANSYWPEVLSYDFWGLELADIWKISWSEGSNWTQKLLGSKYQWLGLFFLKLASISQSEPLEIMLDYLTGNEQLAINDKRYKSATSPLKDFYTSEARQTERPDTFYQTISHLIVLRSKLRERQASEDKALRLTDMLGLVDLYETSGTRMINTSPYNQASESVQLMTVYKAKGLEFEHVFLLDCVDEVWGEKARASNNKLSLPANLAHIRRAGSSDDERLRVFFVAITRAKAGLYLASATNNYSGKATTRLKYLDEREQDDGSTKALALPEKYQQVIRSTSEVPDITSLELDWSSRHTSSSLAADLKDLLADRIKNYQLSPTDLNKFIDLERGGPRAFMLENLLRFPSAPSSSASYGSAIHECLDWYQQQINRGVSPSNKQLLAEFERYLLAKKLARDELAKRLEQGEFELTSFLTKAAFQVGDRAEEKFVDSGVFVGEAHLNGKIDKIEVDKDEKAVTIVDYKTGRPAAKWESKLKLHKYKQQLYIYKMLIEGAANWRGWTVSSERLDFIQPDSDGECLSLELKFNQKEYDETKALVEAMWRHVMALSFPDVSQYSADFAGSRQFERDLINGKV